MGGPINMEQKGCESIGCYTHFVTFNHDLNHDLDLGFSRLNFEKVISQEWECRLTWNERDVSRQNVGPMLWLSMYTSHMTLTLDFQGQILKKNYISGMGWPINMEKKGCESIECWNHIMTSNYDLTHDLDLGFSRSNFEIAVSQDWEGRLTWNERDVSWIWCWMHNGFDLGPRCMANRSAK